MPLYPPTHVTPPMVDAELCIHDSPLNKTVETDGNKVNNDIHCIHCDKLKLELQKAKLEISSYEEILKLMQEEICGDSSTLRTTTTKWRKEMDTMHLHNDNTATNREWIQFSSKKHVKSYKKSDKCVTEITDQLNMTSNRFTPLGCVINKLTY
jgi:hypothetical protein